MIRFLPGRSRIFPSAGRASYQALQVEQDAAPSEPSTPNTTEQEPEWDELMEDTPLDEEAFVTENRAFGAGEEARAREAGRRTSRPRG